MNVPNAITRNPSIRATNLCKRFESGKFTIDVIKGVTLDVLPAELTLVVGPSGSGKSTLLSMLSGLLKPDSGEVEVLGQQIWGLSDNEIDQFRLAHCGFVFQGFNLFPALTAREQVAMPLQYLPALAAQAEQLADAALAQVGHCACNRQAAASAVRR